MTGWYYLHTNGDLIFKRWEPEVEPGGFVRKVWPVNTGYRADAWTVAIEALALGARRDRIDGLVKAWGLTNVDGRVYADRAGFTLDYDEDSSRWRAYNRDIHTGPDRVGSGATVLESLADLARLGFTGATT